MTESLAADLKLHRYPRQLPIGGLMADGASRCYIQTNLHSIFPNQNFSLKFYVVPKIPTLTPPSHSERLLRQGQEAAHLQAYDDHLHQSLQQLWELDKTPESPSLSANDKMAIFHFNDTHQIQPHHRYKIKLPRSDHPLTIGQS